MSSAHPPQRRVVCPTCGTENTPPPKRWVFRCSGCKRIIEGNRHPDWDRD